MRRLLMLLMLCLLPLQVSWGAVADYCEHERSQVADHFGHHDHGDCKNPGDPDGNKQAGKSDTGHDHCHLAAYLGIPATFTFSTHRWTQSYLPFGHRFSCRAAPDQPERPKWPPLA